MKKHVSPLGRNGFTLIEVLVTLTLLAVLAAAIFPTISNQADSADSPRTINDLTAVNAAIDAFQLDMRPEFPLDLTQLITVPGGTDKALDGAVYPATSLAAWSGPYLDITAPPIATGFGASIATALVCLTSGTATVQTDTDGCDSGEDIAVELTGLGAAYALELEQDIDRATTVATVVNTNGKFRVLDAATDRFFYVVGTM